MSSEDPGANTSTVEGETWCDRSAVVAKSREKISNESPKSGIIYPRIYINAKPITMT